MTDLRRAAQRARLHRALDHGLDMVRLRRAFDAKSKDAPISPKDPSQGNWVPASGGKEEPFRARSGARLQYMWQPRTGKHAYMNLDTDMILSDEEARNHLRTYDADPEEEDDGPIEAHGVKGMKSTPWQKVFKNAEALNKWVEKNDAEVHGTRAATDAPAEMYDPSQIADRGHDDYEEEGWDPIDSKPGSRPLHPWDDVRRGSRDAGGLPPDPQRELASVNRQIATMKSTAGWSKNDLWQAEARKAELESMLGEPWKRAGYWSGSYGGGADAETPANRFERGVISATGAERGAIGARLLYNMIREALKGKGAKDAIGSKTIAGFLHKEIQELRSHGYSDAKIVSFLGSHHPGLSDEDIRDLLAGRGDKAARLHRALDRALDQKRTYANLRRVVRPISAHTLPQGTG